MFQSIVSRGVAVRWWHLPRLLTCVCTALVLLFSIAWWWKTTPAAATESPKTKELTAPRAAAVANPQAREEKKQESNRGLDRSADSRLPEVPPHEKRSGLPQDVIVRPGPAAAPANDAAAQIDPGDRERKANPSSTVEATAGKPYGVCRVAMSRDGQDDWNWYDDQLIEVRAADRPVWFLAYGWQDAADAERSTLVGYFLFVGDVPQTVDVTIAGKTVARELPVREIADSSHDRLLGQWWGMLCDQSSRDTSAPIRELSGEMLAILGRRLGLAPRRPLASHDADFSQLESQFERTVGMLFGLESIRLAMMANASADEVGHDLANQELPRPVPVQGWRIPGNFRAAVGSPGTELEFAL